MPGRRRTASTIRCFIGGSRRPSGRIGAPPCGQYARPVQIDVRLSGAGPSCWLICGLAESGGTKAATILDFLRVFGGHIRQTIIKSWPSR
jgi:hypothetical protein